jgi:GT2 family glycosyltransferase
MAFDARELLTLVVVTHDSRAFVEELATSWLATARRWPRRPAVVVADAGSQDDTRAAVAARWPAADVLALANSGFGAAANAAIARAATPWVLLCNPDLRFPKEFAAALERVVPQGDAEQVDWIARTAIFAPRLRNDDGSPQPSAGRYPTIRGIVRDQFRTREQRKYLTPQPTTESLIDWASAACLLVRKAAFEAVGGFDEKYFLYVEEVDLQRRLRDAGWTVRAAWPIVPEWAVDHRRPNAARPPRPAVQRYAARGLLRYFTCHGSRGQLAAYRVLATVSGRLGWRAAWAPRAVIRATPTGP